MTEQRYKAVLAVIADGRTVTQVERDCDVARQTVHVWLERYELPKGELFDKPLEARIAINDWREHYNHHPGLGMLAPLAFARAWTEGRK